MKRAEVWQERSDGFPAWCVGTCHYRDRIAGIPIHERPDYMNTIRTFPTHAAALAHALAEVGLTEKNTEKEKNR